MKRNVVIISGYFNPIHRGHIEYVNAARKLATADGLVYVIVNNDAQAVLKKGHSFIPELDRMATIAALREVDKAILSIDIDRAVCKTLEMLATSGDYEVPTHFLNDGDSAYKLGSPEEPICTKYGIKMAFGGDDKVQSSTNILKNLPQ